jgi:hypothetical protein
LLSATALLLAGKKSPTPVPWSSVLPTFKHHWNTSVLSCRTLAAYVPLRVELSENECLKVGNTTAPQARQNWC